MEDEFTISNPESNTGGGSSYGKLGGLTKGQIILEQFRKVLELGNNLETRGGYTNTIMIGGLVKEEWVPDSRLQYENAIFGLYDALLSDFDIPMKKAADKILTELEKLDPTDKEKKRKLMRSLFQELSKMIGRNPLNWFTRGSAGGMDE